MVGTTTKNINTNNNGIDVFISLNDFEELGYHLEEIIENENIQLCQNDSSEANNGTFMYTFDKYPSEYQPSGSDGWHHQYSFALYPENHEPSGTCNLSKIYPSNYQPSGTTNHERSGIYCAFEYDFEKTKTVTINKNCDLITKMYLTADLQNSTKVIGNETDWIKNLGNKMMKSVDISINDNAINNQYSEWNNIMTTMKNEEDGIMTNASYKVEDQGIGLPA